VASTVRACETLKQPLHNPIAFQLQFKAVLRSRAVTRSLGPSIMAFQTNARPSKTDMLQVIRAPQMEWTSGAQQHAVALDRELACQDADHMLTPPITCT
jgi:hypothetical protein